MNAPKLNIFALPSQTTILLGVIVAILLGAVFLGSVGASPIPVWLLALGLLLLPLRAYLARPERNFARYSFSLAGDDLADLKKVVASYAEKIGLSRVPQLVVSSKKTGLHFFGTFRHWYIAISYEQAKRLQTDLTNPDQALKVEAKLIHELHHFKTGDHWKLGYVRKLLRYTFAFLGWAFIFFTGFGYLIFIAAPDFLRLNFQALGEQLPLPSELRQHFIQLMPSPVVTEQLRQKFDRVDPLLVRNFIFGSLMPFLLMGLLLWKLYLPKLWRLRELYADAGVAQTQGEIAPWRVAFFKNMNLSYVRKHPLDKSSAEAPTALQMQKRNFRDYAKAWWITIKGLPGNHPTIFKRIVCLVDPSKAFDNWRDTVILAGSLTLLLDILLTGLLTWFYVGEWPMHFPTLSIFALLSFYLIPALAQGHAVRSDLLKTISAIMGMRLILVLFTIGLLVLFLIFAPGTLSGAMEAAAAGIVRSVVRSDELAFDDLHASVIKASIVNLGQVAIVFILLLAALPSVTFLLRRLLTWYGFPEAKQRLMKVAYGVIGLVALFFAMTVLPLITMALIRRADLLNPTSLIIPVLGLMITAVGLVWFFRADRQYAQRCPNCGASVGGAFHLGKRCEVCDGALLHPWLIADYRI